MAHAFDQEGIISSRDIRSLINSLTSFNLKTITTNVIGDYFGISRGLFLGVLFVGLLLILSRQIENLSLFTLEWLVGTSPLWVLPAVIVIAWKSWILYARSLYLSKQKPILLEVRFPRDIVKSPRAMEGALTYLWTASGEVTFFHRIWLGQVRPIFSLEMASFGGDVHFYVWSFEQNRSQVETALYGQYPEVEISEVEDYATRFRYDPDKHMCFGTDWRLEPNNDAYQIRTYIDYELDRDPKEEYKIDPLSQVIEVLGSLKPTEQMWVQLVITYNKDYRRVPGTWFATESRWVGLIRDEIDKIRFMESGGADASSWRRFARIPVPRVQEQLRSMDRNMGKLVFSVGMRGCYIADRQSFSGGRIGGIRWLWRPFNNPHWSNQLQPRRWHNIFDWPWQDLWHMRWNLVTRRFLDCYRRRSHFWAPWIIPHNMLSVEAIATLWHPPSRGISALGLERIGAKKAAPPSNLPK